VVRRAEEAARLLRDFDALLVPGPGIVAIGRRLPDISTRLTAQAAETSRQLAEPTSGVTLDGLTSQWQTVRAELVTYVNVLAERATTLERALERLAGLHETWTKARADARTSRAPGQVVDRIDGILSASAQTRTRLQEERAATLVLQDRVAQQVAGCDEMLARLDTAREDVAGRLLVPDGVPVWGTEQLSGAVTELPDRIRRAVESDILELRRFASDQRARLSTLIALFVGLALLMYTARRAAGRWLAPLGATAPTLAVLDRPISAALLLALLAAGFSPPQSRVVQALGEMLVLVPALRVVRLGMEPRLVPVLYGLGALVLADHGRRLASTVPLLEQQIFLLEVLGVLGLLGWTLGWQRWRAGASGTMERGGVLRIGAGAALVAFAGAGAAAAAGYMRLALFIGSGILGSIFVALVLYAGVKVAGALVAVGLGSPPFRGFWMVQRHRPLLEQRIGGGLRWLAVAGWAIFALRHFGLWHPAVSLTDAALAAELHRGSLSISLGGVLAFALAVVATFMLSAIIRFVLEEEVGPRLAPERVLPYAVSTLVHYALLLAGFLIGLAVLGVDLTKITIVAGALGVGIGFGLQGIVNNFVSGLVVLYERRINVGDAVQIGDVGGRVQQLGLRACTVRTWEGAEVIVPNASLVSDKVANWTLSDRMRRIDFAVGVAYGTLPEKVADVLLGVARAHAEVVADPAPIVLFLGFGESALRFELRVWTNRFDRWLQIQSELAGACYAALREAAIDIPFPQREVRLRQA
jgi:small-conductance mechanosensitive channel